MADRFDIINLAKSMTTTLGSPSTANVNIDANTLFIDGTNNRVGIGTATPSRRFDIQESSTNYQLRIGDAGTNFYDIGRDTGNGLLTFFGNQTVASGYVFSTVNGERMRIDTSGRVTTPAQPAFFAYPNTNGNIGTGTYTLPLTTFNTGSHYNTANGRFTAPVAGVYHFSFGVQHNASVNDNLIVQLQINGSAYGAVVTAELFSTTSYQIVTASASVYMNVNDYATIAAVSGTGWGDNTWFSGHLVG